VDNGMNAACQAMVTEFHEKINTVPGHWWLSVDLPGFCAREPDVKHRLWVLELPDGKFGGCITVPRNMTQKELDRVVMAVIQPWKDRGYHFV
jgi:hypothetical protein